MASPVRRRRSAVPFIIAAVVVVGLVIATYLMRRGSTAADTDVNATPSVDASTAASTPQSAAQGGALPAGKPDPQRGREAALALIQQRRAQRTESLGKLEQTRQRAVAQFDAEKVDAAWAPRKEVDLKKVAELPEIAKNVAAPTSMSVSCRSSMCRIESSFASNGDAQDWAMLYMASVGSNLPNALVTPVRNPDGTTTVRIYARAR